MDGGWQVGCGVGVALGGVVVKEGSSARVGKRSEGAERAPALRRATTASVSAALSARPRVMHRLARGLRDRITALHPVHACGRHARANWEVPTAIHRWLR